MQVTLSRRNLLTLLHKLEMSTSHRTLVKPDGTVVTAQRDEDHYANRPEGPGPMHPDTEAFITDMNAALEIVRQRRARCPSKHCRCCHTHKT